MKQLSWSTKCLTPQAGLDCHKLDVGGIGKAGFKAAVAAVALHGAETEHQTEIKTKFTEVCPKCQRPSSLAAVKQVYHENAIKDLFKPGIARDFAKAYDEYQREFTPLIVTEKAYDFRLGFWKGKPITRMTDEHIRNAMAYILRSCPIAYQQHYKDMKHELKRREQLGIKVIET